MQLVEQHVIGRGDPRYAVIDEAAFKSKNLYNAANYEIRQVFIHEGRYLNYNEVQRRMQSHEAYKALPAKVSQEILMVLDRNWRKGFFEALKAYEEDPSKFKQAHEGTQETASQSRPGARHQANGMHHQ